MKIVKFASIFLLLFSCYRVPDKVDPKVSCLVEERYIQTLSSPFTPLTDEEKKEDFAKEYLIGEGFAKDFDLYQALSSFKRADFLLKKESSRKLEIKYFITLCYYLGKKYKEAVNIFEQSELFTADNSFKAFHDLLVLLFDSYQKLKESDKEKRILEVIQKFYPETAKKLKLSTAVASGDLSSIDTPSGKELVSQYMSEKKSVRTAQLLNVVLPGAGYSYVGQQKTAVTAFLFNALFIFATYEFFHNSYMAAGIITASLEAGWYFGGIYGAGEEAKYFNERLYEQKAQTFLNSEKLFPVLILKYAF